LKLPVFSVDGLNFFPLFSFPVFSHTGTFLIPHPVLFFSDLPPNSSFFLPYFPFFCQGPWYVAPNVFPSSPLDQTTFFLQFPPPSLFWSFSPLFFLPPPIVLSLLDPLFLTPTPPRTFPYTLSLQFLFFLSPWP